MKKEKIKPKIGNLLLSNRVFLAPMHQINDIPFRVLCKRAGAGLVYTGLINPQNREKLLLKDKPALQLACNSTKGIPEFIKKYDRVISLYDFNLGCPSPHAKSSKVGYFMTSKFKAIEDILKTIKNNTKKPITIKIRKMPEENLRKIIKIAEKYCQAIAVHPRTQQQGYSGEPDIEFAKKVKNLTKLPIIYSGNIRSKDGAEKMLEEFDFIMVGRASLGNPHIFSDILDLRKKKSGFNDWLRIAKKNKLDLKKDFKQIKFQALNFTRDFPGSAKVRKRISEAKTTKEILKIITNQNKKTE